jgi:hypothetical protein
MTFYYCEWRQGHQNFLNLNLSVDGMTKDCMTSPRLHSHADHRVGFHTMSLLSDCAQSWNVSICFIRLSDFILENLQAFFANRTCRLPTVIGQEALLRPLFFKYSAFVCNFPIFTVVIVCIDKYISIFYCSLYSVKPYCVFQTPSESGLLLGQVANGFCQTADNSYCVHLQDF